LCFALRSERRLFRPRTNRQDLPGQADEKPKAGFPETAQLNRLGHLEFPYIENTRYMEIIQESVSCCFYGISDCRLAPSGAMVKKSVDI
jgi:hypothetical protein